MQPVTKAIEIMENSFSVIYLSPLAAILAGLRRDPLPPELDQLAEEIKLQTATADPIAIGVLLRKAKAKIPHGQWAAWFEEEHFAFPRHVAIECMRLAKQRPLAAADRQQATKMSEVIRRQINQIPNGFARSTQR
jgi:hypothetical protein